MPRHQPPQRPVLPRAPGGAAADQRSRGRGTAVISTGTSAAVRHKRGAGDRMHQAALLPCPIRNACGLRRCSACACRRFGSVQRRAAPDGRVQVPPPAPHALLIRAPLPWQRHQRCISTPWYSCAPDERGVHAQHCAVSSHVHTRRRYEPHTDEQAVTYEAAQVALQAVADSAQQQRSPPCRVRFPPSSCRAC